jgi:hypothetical protein
VDGFALRIENAFFERNVDLSFHFCAVTAILIIRQGRGERLRFCLWKLFERATHFGAEESARLSKDESCLSSSAMDC